MGKRINESEETSRKNLESQPKCWYIVVSLVSGVGGGAIVLFLVLGNELGPAQKFDVFIELLLFLLAFLGVVGYGIYTWMGDKLDSRLDERLEKEQEEIENSRNLFRARIQRNMGFIFWKLFEVEKKKRKGKNTSVLKELIKLAIERTKQSLKYASELPKNEYKEDINQCKANWVYFLAKAARTKGYEVTEQDKEQALNFVNEILK